MPRKQNGWGPSKSHDFKGVNNRIDKSKGKRGSGQYPSNRSFGATITRSIIEKFDLDSKWAQWRKGLEFYYQFAWYRLKSLNPFTQEYEDVTLESVLYQGQPEEYTVKFDGYKFATKNADTNAHYVLKRTVPNPFSLGSVTAVLSDKTAYPENFKNREIFVSVDATTSTPLISSMIGDRVTDGETEATIKDVLDVNFRPAIYKGKSEGIEFVVKADLQEVNGIGFLVDNDYRYQEFVGKIGYVKDLFVRRPLNIQAVDFYDADYTFDVETRIAEKNQNFFILDPGNLPTSLFNIGELDALYESQIARVDLTGRYTFQKEDYQRFYGSQYLTADLVESQVTELSVPTLPFEIKSVLVEPPFLKFTAVTFPSEMKLYTESFKYIIFDDRSFTKKTVDQYNGEYYHVDGQNQEQWQLLDTDVDPWMDEIFTNDNSADVQPDSDELEGPQLVPATLYTCTCPAYSHAQLRIPQSQHGDLERAVNRQQRYPLPTAQGRASTASVGLSKAAGQIQSWETETDRRKFKICKHTIAAMFIERIKTKEPNSYPSAESREKFEAKLKQEVADVAAEFTASYERGELSLQELVFAAAQGLNLDEVELASAILNTRF